MAKAKNIITSDVVEIDAPASFVWDILLDFESYKEWNPFTVNVETTLELNTPVKLHIPLPGQTDTSKTMIYTEYLVACETEQLLSWEKRPTDEDKNAARRDQYLEKIDDTRCRYYTTDIFLGIHQDSIMKKSGAWVQQAFDSVAHGLKKRAEALYAEQTA